MALNIEYNSKGLPIKETSGDIVIEYTYDDSDRIIGYKYGDIEYTIEYLSDTSYKLTEVSSGVYTVVTNNEMDKPISATTSGGLKTDISYNGKGIVDGIETNDGYSELIEITNSLASFKTPDGTGFVKIGIDSSIQKITYSDSNGRSINTKIV